MYTNNTSSLHKSPSIKLHFASLNNSYDFLPGKFFPETIPKMPTKCSLAVFQIIYYQTICWKKAYDRISISQLVKKTGLSRQGVYNGLKYLISNGWVEKIVEGTKGRQEIYYGLNLQKIGIYIQKEGFKNSPTSLNFRHTPVYSKDIYDKKIDKERGVGETKKAQYPRQASESVPSFEKKKKTASPSISLEMRKIVTEDDRKKLEGIIEDEEERSKCLSAALAFMDKMHHNAFKKERAVDIAIIFYHRKKQEKLKSKARSKEVKTEKGKHIVEEFVILNNLNKHWILEKDHVVVSRPCSHADIVIHYDDIELEEKLKKRYKMMRGL